jgi:hypothetical protein
MEASWGCHFEAKSQNKAHNVMGNSKISFTTELKDGEKAK